MWAYGRWRPFSGPVSVGGYGKERLRPEPGDATTLPGRASSAPHRAASSGGDRRRARGLGARERRASSGRGTNPGAGAQGKPRSVSPGTARKDLCDLRSGGPDRAPPPALLPPPLCASSPSSPPLGSSLPSPPTCLAAGGSRLYLEPSLSAVICCTDLGFENDSIKTFLNYRALFCFCFMGALIQVWLLP